MQRRAWIRWCLGLALVAVALAASSGQHRRGYPTPPAPSVPEGPTPPEPKLSPRRLDNVAMEREAKEMSALAASIPGDVEQLKKGLMPSSALDKLKRIEKLAKQLRRRMAP